MPNSFIKRLFIDLEVSPNIVFSWRTGSKLFVNPDGIIQERAIISAAWKWQVGDRVEVRVWDKKQSDKTILEELVGVMNEADEVVGHWASRFDVPWFRTRCLFHGISPLPAYKIIDTCTWARRLFYFNSCKLDYIAGFLGIGRKLKTDHELWKKVVLNDDRAALKYMALYNQQDVVLLEKVWKRLSEVAAPKTHAGVLAGKDRYTCPHCASSCVGHDKVRVTAAGTVQHQMRCRSCNHYFT